MTKIAQMTKYTQTEVVEALSNPLVQRSLDNRGIPWEITDQRLNPLQVATLNLLFNPADTRSQTAKLKALGVNPNQFKRWQSYKPFMDAMKEMGERLFGENTGLVIKALTDKALEGDVNASKLYLAMAGRWDSAKTVEATNIQFLLTKVLECIQTHVRDQDTLMAIAQDLGQITNPTQREINA